jgi:surfactin synthase thioesterase subunit
MIFSYLRSLRREGIAVLPARYPGREKRVAEQPIRSFEPLVGALASVIAELSSAPFALFGHSLGAYVAFEVARELTRVDVRPEVLLLASAPGPVALGSAGGALVGDTSELSDEALLSLFVLLGGISAAMAATPDLSAMLASALRSDIEVLGSYRYVPEPPLDVPVSVFVGRDDLMASQDQVAAWRECTTEVFEMHTLPGGHYFTGAPAAQLCKLVGDSCLRGTPDAGK